jgi:hypothetical protein
MSKRAACGLTMAATSPCCDRDRNAHAISLQADLSNLEAHAGVHRDLCPCLAASDGARLESKHREILTEGGLPWASMSRSER